MNAFVGPAPAMSFRARSLLAFVLEPNPPVVEWLEGLDAWLARSPTFFASKPVILEMSALDIGLKEYRDFLGDLALRHIRVMAVENPSRTLVGPHLPPIVTGGRPVESTTGSDPEAIAPAAAPKPEAPTVAAAKTRDKPTALVVDTHVRSGQSIVNFDGDVIIIGRVASGAEIIAGGSVHVYGALQGRVIAGISGDLGARIFCTEARAEMLCIGGAHLTAEGIDSAADGRAIEVRLDGDELKIRVID